MPALTRKPSPWLLRLLPVALLVAAGVAVAPSAFGESGAALSCNPRGSWVASTAEANRFFRRLTGQTDISLQRGALSATFDGRQLTYGGLSLTLVGNVGGTRTKQVVDMIIKAPYHMSGGRLVLGRGSYTTHYISFVMYPDTGGSIVLHPPDKRISTRANSGPISCSSSTLRWTAPMPSGAGVQVTLTRDRG